MIPLSRPAFAILLESYETYPTTLDAGETAGGRYYARVATCQIACSFVVWIYEESNGLEGWQPYDRWFDSTCHGAVAPDREIEMIWSF